MEMRRTSPLQLHALEKFHAEQKYPTRIAIEELAAVLALTLKQVQGWFIEQVEGWFMSTEPLCLSKKFFVVKGRKGLRVAFANRKIHKQQDSLIMDASSEASDRIHKNKRKKFALQAEPPLLLKRITVLHFWSELGRSSNIYKFL